MTLSALVAVARNGVIGRDNALPWRLPADLKRFKRLTMGHHILMGRKTYESIGKPLPGRVSVVLTRQRGYEAPEGVRVVGELDEAIEVARQAGDEEAFVVGGSQIYALALPRIDRLYLTEVQREVEGDAMFPELDRAEWTEVEREEHAADERHAHAYHFVTLERRR